MTSMSLISISVFRVGRFVIRNSIIDDNYFLVLSIWKWTENTIFYSGDPLVFSIIFLFVNKETHTAIFSWDHQHIPMKSSVSACVWGHTPMFVINQHFIDFYCGKVLHATTKTCYVVFMMKSFFHKRKNKKCPTIQFRPD